MNYRSVASLNNDLVAWSAELPSDLELIVGVPRSGLLVANLLSLYLDLPLTDVGGLITGKVFESGPIRGKGKERTGFLSSKRKVLVVDDSLSSGASMRAVRGRIAAAKLPHTMLYGAAYIVAGRERDVDVFCDIVPQPRLFEWNFRNQFQLQNACVDIDGVLCRDPSGEENDDGPRYRRFIETVPPLMAPSVTIGRLVTTRLEKYRALTEQWLAGHGIEYRELIMMDFPDMAARRASGSHGAFKGAVYKACDAQLFIESSLRQAFEIAHISGKDVLCMETREMVRAGYTPAHRRATPQLAPHHNPIRRALRFARRLIE